MRLETRLEMTPMQTAQAGSIAPLHVACHLNGNGSRDATVASQRGPEGAGRGGQQLQADARGQGTGLAPASRKVIMSIFVSAKTYTPAPEGLHQAVCVDVIDLGMVDGQFGRKPKCRVVFELDKLAENGRPYVTSKTYTLSLHEKSTLHKDLRAWRGRPFSPEELKGFDLERLIDAPCQVLITHVERDGNVYANVSAVMRAEKGKAYQASGQYQRARNHVKDDHDVAEYDDSRPQDDESSF